MKTPADIAALIRWEPGVLDAVRANRQVLDAARKEAQALVDGIEAITAAARALCKHASKKYNDRHIGGWFCPDCGITGA